MHGMMCCGALDRARGASEMGNGDGAKESPTGRQAAVVSEVFSRRSGRRGRRRMAGASAVLSRAPPPYFLAKLMSADGWF